MKLTLDFESRSKADLKETGVWAYGEHPSTEILCMAAKLGDGVPVIWAPDKFLALLPKDHGLPLATFDEIFTPEVTEIEAHNAGFEFAIWNTVGVRRHGWPPLDPNRVSCSMALASTFALPRALGKACEALRLPIQKDAAGQRLMLKMCKPNARGQWQEKPADLKRLFEYCIQDVEAEHALSQALGGTLSTKEREVWHLTLEMNARGVQVDVKGAKIIYKMLQEHETELLEEIRALTSGVVDSPRKVAQLGKWINARCGSAVLHSVDKSAVSVALAREDLPDDVRRVLEIRQSLGKSSTAKYASLLSVVSKDGRLRDNVVYHGASTGRYAGKGVQLQNLPRPHKGFDQEPDLAVLKSGSLYMTRAMYDDPMLVASSALRSMLIAAPDKDLIVADYSGIEARNVMWAAGETEAVEMFKSGGDIYCATAEAIYGRPVTKANKFERQLGKTCIAEGSLVLTDKGLKPIESILLDDRVWDGVEWVSHDGAIYQGEKHVITYQGLTATPDHGVFLDFGPVPFGLAASRLQTLTRTGDGGQEVRLGDDYLPRNLSAETAHICSDSMRWMLYREVDLAGKSHVGEEFRMPKMFTAARPPGSSAWSEVRRPVGQMHLSCQSGVGTLWGPRSPVLVQEPTRFCGVGHGAFAPLDILGGGDRPGRQQRPLRAGQSSPSFPQGADAEHRSQHLDDMAGEEDSRHGYAQPVHHQDHLPVRQSGHDRGADHRESMAERQREAQELAGHPRQARVYDILNCGPRGRYTVSGVLVLNCVLGCGYGMGAPKFQMTCKTQGIEIDEALANKAVKAYRTKYAKVPQFWYAQENAAKMAVRHPGDWIPAKLVKWMFRNRFLRCELPSGRMLWYYEPHIVTDGNTGQEQLGFMGIDTYTKQWSRQTTFGGKLTENIISAISRDIMCEAMLRLDDVGYPVVMTVHDEIISEVPKGFGSVEEFISIMCEEPSWAPGCPIGAEGWRAERYKK